MLQVIDGHGTVAVFPAFAVDIASLLPPPKAVLIPDPNLAAAVRKISVTLSQRTPS